MSAPNRRAQALILGEALYPEIVSLTWIEGDGRLLIEWTWQSSGYGGGMVPTEILHRRAASLVSDPDTDVKQVQGIRIHGSERDNKLLERSRLDEAAVNLWEEVVDAYLELLVVTRVTFGEDVDRLHPGEPNLPVALNRIFGDRVTARLTKMAFVNPRSRRLVDAPVVQVLPTVSSPMIFKNTSTQKLMDMGSFPASPGVLHGDEEPEVMVPFSRGSIREKFLELELIILEGMVVALDDALKSTQDI